jgi:type IV fimbrial biogenesis protein FimT
MIGWRSGTKLQGAVENLRGDLQLAKLAAVKENRSVAVLFSANGYEVFTDDGPTEQGAFDSAPPDNERRFRNRQLPAGVSIDLANTDFNGNDYVRFNNRGLLDSPGINNKVELVTSSNKRGKIELNRLGRINIERNY